MSRSTIIHCDHRYPNGDTCGYSIPLRLANANSGWQITGLSDYCPQHQTDHGNGGRKILKIA